MVNLDELRELMDAHNDEVTANPLAAWYKTGSDLSIAAVNAMPAILAELQAARPAVDMLRAYLAWHLGGFDKSTMQIPGTVHMEAIVAAYDKAVRDA